jgi:hypothetical protein
MATYEYTDKDKIVIILGGTSGNAMSNAGERLNALWFKQFSLAPPSVLPIKLTSFTSSYDKKAVQLNWSTALEANFSHYVIERSADGKNYSEVAIVFANGNTNQVSNYQFKDQNPGGAGKVVYYRIRFVEMSKEASYSEVRMIRLTKETSEAALVTFPNPVKDLLKVTFPATWQRKKVLVEIYNSNGVKLQSTEISDASQTENIQLTQLGRGFYLVKASCGEQILQQRIIKN